MIKKALSVLRKVRIKLTVWRDLLLIQRSGLFERDWYLEKYQDVAQAHIDPLLHYLQAGGFEGRDPSPKFWSRWYLNANKDVSDARINPLLHFIKSGRKEGRLPRPPQGNFSSQTRMRSSREKNGRPYNGKVFCIGYNKTGTTSIGQALEEMGFRLGDQSVAEQLMDAWAIRDFRPVVEYCKSADAFQDLPFSVDFTYQIIDHEFPGSKFILTIRNNADEWYESLIRFYKKLMKTEGTPTADDMKKFPYGGEGWFWRTEQNIFGIDETNACDEGIYKAHYTNHNERVQEYFRYRLDDLLVLNLSQPDAMQSLCKFLGIEYTGQVMPHLNKSRE